MDVQYDLIIVGGGPAGMTAGIYAGRAGLKVAMMEKSAPGGKMIKTDIICNYPGFDEIDGAGLSMNMFNHTQESNVEYLYGDLTSIEISGNKKTLHTEDGSTYTAHAVIAATGTVERTLGFKEDDMLLGRGLSYCAVCDGAFYRNKEVLVIGGGNSALEEASYLTQFADKVILVIRRDVFRGDLLAQEQVLNNPKIEVVKHHIPESYIISSDNKLAGVSFKNLETNEIVDIKAGGLFPYIGSDPASAYLKDLDILNEEGYIIADDRMHTKIPGLFGAGDINDKHLRQIVTAAGDGAIAAQEAFHYIQTLKSKES
ncbi:MAG: FAD-dependent oxidoreductase [Erysipelothrix sp.]|nr:FAD-dependent oxidoreductase [Erysipelothrix sp.]